ncbi:MAG: helix-turn-helix transcriptional regulator [Treponema sp.]|jgi:transcriptional regulator with XRE-family HTH domain|nr:helix-turn-helix transcriptional regulator [Treponema sp.]
MEVRGSDIVERADMILKQRNLKRASACEYAGISISAMTDWSRRGTIPAADTLYKVATFLRVSLVWLLTGADDAGLAPDERDLLDGYRRLDDRDRQDVVGIIAVKLERYPQREASRLGAD